MKKNSTLFGGKLLLFALLCFSSFIGSAQNTAHKIATPNGDSVSFLQYIPATHNLTDASRKYPLVIFLHGGGETSDDNSIAPGSPLYRIEGITGNSNEPGYGPNRLVRLGHKLDFIWDGKRDTMMAISPLCRKTHRAGPRAGEYLGWQWLSPEYVPSIITYATTVLKADPDRIYLTGLSLGGGGVWRFISQGTTNVTQIAAAAPISAVAWNNAGANLGNIANNVGTTKLPVWAFHALDDGTTSPIGGTIQPVDTINNHTPAPAIPALETLWPSGGHNVYPRLYNIDNSAYAYGYDGILNIYEWFLGQHNDTLTTNIAPVAIGQDTTIYSSPGTATLRASASYDPNGRIARYLWKKLTAPAGVNLSSITITKERDTLSSTGVSGLTTIGNYTFELIVVDNRGDYRRDTVTITVTTAPPPGGKAVQMNTTSSRILAGNVTQLKNAAAFTIEAYFKYDSTSTSWPTHDAVIFRNHVSDSNRIKLKVAKATKRIHFNVANGDDTEGYTATNVVTHGNWYHIAAVFDGAQTGNASRMKVYINGDLQPLTYVGTIPSVTSNSTPAVMFGGEPSCCQTAAIDEVRLWDTAVAGSTINTWKDKQLANCHPNFGRLKIYWPLDDNATPATAALGTSYTGAIINGSYITSPVDLDSVTCTPGKAVKMNVASGRIQTGNVTELVNVSTFTLEAQIKYDTVNSYWTNIMRKGTNGTNRIMFHVGPGDNAIHVIINNAGNASGATLPNVVSPGAWYHVAAVYDGTQTGNANKLKIYVDGVQQPLTFSGTIPATTSSINTAAFIAGGDPICCNIGNIDEVRVWSTALSGTTINEWRDKSLGSCHPDTANLALYWPLNNSANPAVATAELGTSYTGTISGSSYINTSLAADASECVGSPAVLAPYEEVAIIPAAAATGRLYPNPTEGKVQLSLQASGNKLLTIHVIDMQGRFVYRKQTNVVKGINNVNFDISALRTGSYIIDVREGQSSVGKYKVLKK